MSYGKKDYIELLKIWNKIKDLCGNIYESDDHSLYDESIKIAFRSGYIYPSGTHDEITYEGKPEKSFRISGHWSWFANVNKAPKDTIQCYCPEIGEPTERNIEMPEKPTKPIERWAICFYENGVYHQIAGFNGKYFMKPSNKQIMKLIEEM